MSFYSQASNQTTQYLQGIGKLGKKRHISILQNFTACRYVIYSFLVKQVVFENLKNIVTVNIPT